MSTIPFGHHQNRRDAAVNGCRDGVPVSDAEREAMERESAAERCICHPLAPMADPDCPVCRDADAPHP